MKVTAICLIAALALGAASMAESGAQPQQARQTERAEDPVCHLPVRRNPELSVTYRGRTYYFCMKADMEAFRKDPEKYLQGQDHMHPEPRG